MGTKNAFFLQKGRPRQIKGHNFPWKVTFDLCSTPGGKPSEANPPVTLSRRNPSSAYIMLHPLGVFEVSCPFLHQNDGVTKKPLPADAADVQRLKGKPQFVLKPINGGASNPAPGETGANKGDTR